MFGVLLESRTKRRRFVNGSPISIAIHAAAIGLVIAVGPTGKMSPPVKMAAPDVVVAIHLFPPAALGGAAPTKSANKAHRPTKSAPRRTATPVSVPPALPTVAIPNIVVPPPPAIDLPTGPLASASDFAVPTTSSGEGANGAGGVGGGLVRGIIGPDDENDRSRVWRGSDVFTQMTTVIYPRYPESLRRSGVSGRVVVRFVVDTTGRVDLKSVEVLESSHKYFTRAVIDALPRYRFRPARQNGHRVTSVAELPVEFRIVDR
jgi:periplasmic protein TonB